MFAGQVACFFQYFFLYVGIELVQAAANLVETLLYTGELGGVIKGDLNAELPIVNSSHALLQML